MEITCIILAGGKGLRLGEDKLQVIVGRKHLLEGVLSRACTVCSDAIVVTGKEGDVPPLNGSSPSFRVVHDAMAEKGPLVGIYTGLSASDTFFNFVFAGDMPFLNHALLNYMWDSVDDFDIVIPDLNGLVEPLHAIYSKNCLAPIKFLLSREQFSVHQILPLVKVRRINSTEIDRFDPEHWSFFNINTREDLEKARRRAKRMGE